MLNVDTLNPSCSFLLSGIRDKQTGTCLGKWTTLYDNSENAFYLVPRGKGAVKDRSADFGALAPSLRHPDTPKGSTFFMSSLRATWQDWNDFFFSVWDQVLLGVMILLFTKMSQGKKLLIKPFLPFTSECDDRLLGCMRGSLWEWQLSNNSILNTSLFYGLRLETTSLHCRFY